MERDFVYLLALYMIGTASCLSVLPMESPSTTTTTQTYISTTTICPNSTQSVVTTVGGSYTSLIPATPLSVGTTSTLSYSTFVVTPSSLVSIMPSRSLANIYSNTSIIMPTLSSPTFITFSTLPSSTLATSSPIPPPRVCSIKLEEVAHGSFGLLDVSFNLTVPGAGSTYKQSPVTLTSDIVMGDLPLSYDVLIFFTDNQSRNIKQRQRVHRGFNPALVPDPVWKNWIVNIVAGLEKWSTIDSDPSHLPYCQVGIWDSGLFWTRIVYCYWNC